MQTESCQKMFHGDEVGDPVIRSVFSEMFFDNYMENGLKRS